MARVQPYERVVDAVLIHTSSTPDVENGVKIKEEPIDTTSNTDTTEDYTVVRNCFSLIDHDYHHYHDKSLSKNDISCKNINNTKNRYSSNDHNAHSNDTKTDNKERKNVKTKKEIHDTLIHFKKQKCSNEISNNKNSNALCTTTENIRGKRKQQNIILDCKTKIQHKNKSARKKSAKCDICFRKFSSFRNCEAHKLYYELIRDSNCRNCNNYVTREKLQSHICHRSVRSVRINLYTYNCNFCSRIFKSKVFLQSHLFHTHNELICFNNTIKYETSKSDFQICKVNTSTEIDTLRINANKESCLNNLIKSEKINSTLTNNVNKSYDDNVMDNVMDTEKSRLEKSFNNEISPTKRLRQPTLTEYLELCKKKRDIKLSPNKLKDDFSTCVLHHDEQIEENSRPKFSEEQNGHFDSLLTKSDNLPKEMAHSIQKQSAKHEICLRKKPFVKLHADVEMMKAFLEKLSDTVVKNKDGTEDGTSDVSYDRGIPYSLRSLSGVSSVEIGSNSGIKKNKNEFKKSRFDIEFSTKKEQNIIDVDKTDSKVDWKIIMARFKCKECTIPLTRYDERPRNSYQTSTIEAMKNISLTQCNFTLVQESDVQNKMILKNLEVSLERLTAVSTTDIEAKTSDVEKPNYFLCKVCKKNFSSKLAKRVHIKSSHVVYMSSICDARYTLKHKLLQHYLREHLFKQNQCCICYMLLSDYKTLKQHLNVHCLKYIQKENDRYPIDIELKCNLIKRTYKCLHCDKTFSSQSSLIVHRSCCLVQEEMKEDQKDFMKEANAHPKDIPEKQYKKKTDENVTCDDRINSDDLCKSLNSDCVNKSNEHQILLHSEKESKINEANRNFPVNNLIEEKNETINESQDPKKLLENNSFTIRSDNQNIANTQLDDITTKSTTYPCNICGKQFHTSKNLEIHIRTFSFTTDICPMCGTGFSSKRLLQTHITAAHVPQISKTYSFHCVFCNQGFFKKRDLRPHILHLHGQQVLNTLTRNPNMSQEKSDESITHTAICNVCNLVFETHDRYVEHRMYYYKNHTFTCSLCAQNFQGMYMFHHHNKLIHYSEDKRKSYNYICDICNEGFNHESHFYSHNMHVHSTEVNLMDTAKESEDRSRYSSDVQEQIRNFSTDQQKQNEQLSNEYTCQICQLKCIEMDHMTKHKEFYSNDGDFRCDKCNRRCKTLDLLDQHRKLTHFYRDVYNGHACHTCGEVLETVTALKCHEKHFHSNISDNTSDSWKNCQIEHPYESKNNTCNVTEYNCLFCDMKFSTPNTVQTHIVYVHMDDIIAKRATLKLTLPIIDSVDIQKQFVETDKVSSASTSASSSSSLSSSLSSEDKSTQLLQRSMIQQSNILSNTITKNEMNDKTTIELLKSFRTIRSKNNITKKTPILCINKSKDNISTCSTIAPNMKSKVDTSVSSSIGSTFRTGTPRTEFENDNSISLSGSTNDLRKSYGVPLRSRSINEFKTISSSNRSTIINKSKAAPVYLLSTRSLSTFKGVMSQSWKSNEITNQKSESVNSYDSYSCPLCPLEYPSLMFFQAHLKYAHADSIRTDELTIPQANQVQKTSMIECLLCPCTFVDEIKYKKHLRNSHTYYVYIPNSEGISKTNNVCNPLLTQTNTNKRSTIPETITVDDDDNDNVKNTSDQGTAEVTTEVVTTLDHKKQNEKIGKLRVKPFAKIIENLSTDSALKLL